MTQEEIEKYRENLADENYLSAGIDAIAESLARLDVGMTPIAVCEHDGRALLNFEKRQKGCK